MSSFYPHTLTVDGKTRLCCTYCGKTVSSPFRPDPTDTPDKGLIVRAVIECPECLEKRSGAGTA